MLKDDLYSIQNETLENNIINVTVDLNEKHLIFEGHFPEQPVLPGVCMLQMVKEILEAFFKNKLQLAKADDIRFSALINPNENKILKFSIQYNLIERQSLNISAKILTDKNVVCCKIKATFKIIN